MREIKFKAWNPENKSMVEFDNEKAANDIYIAKHLLSLMANKHELGENLLMQFTGLQDKNGVDIYESDLIINESGRVSEVVFNEYCATFDSEVRYTSGKDSDYGFKNSMWKNYVLVIGNIHSNPELLEK